MDAFLRPVIKRRTFDCTRFFESASLVIEDTLPATAISKRRPLPAQAISSSPIEKGPKLAPRPKVLEVRLSDYAVRCASALSPLIAACAAARRAMGTRNGEQDT